MFQQFSVHVKNIAFTVQYIELSHFALTCLRHAETADPHFYPIVDGATPRICITESHGGPRRYGHQSMGVAPSTRKNVPVLKQSFARD